MTEKSADNRRIVSNSAVLLLRMVLMMGIAFYSSRILLRELGISDFGLYGVVGGIVAMFGSLRSVFASSIQRFLNFEMGKGNVAQLNKVFSMGVVIHVLLAVFFLILAEFVGLWFLNHKLNIDPDRLYAANWVFQFSVFTAIITILTVPYDAVIIANERMKAFAYITLLDSLLKFIVVLLIALNSGDKLIFYSLCLFVISILIRTISWLFCKKNFQESQFIFIWDKDLFSSLGTFAGWNFLGNTAQTLSNEGVNLLLNVFGGTPVNAARSVAYQVRSVTMQFLSNILLAVNPHMIKVYSKNDKEKFMKMLFFISKLSYFVIFLIVIPLIFLSDIVLQVWLINVPPLAVVFVKWILIYLLIRSFHSPIDILFKATGKIRNYQIVDAITLFMTLPISYILLVFNYEIYYVFVTMSIVEVLNLISILYLAQRMKELDVRIYWLKVVLPCLGVSIVCIPVCYGLFVTYNNLTFFDFLLLLFLMSIVNIIGVFLVGFNRIEKRSLYQKIKNLNKFLKK